jgi:hypothetical protein
VKDVKTISSITILVVLLLGVPAYAWDDATILALIYTGDLLAPESVIAKIEEDLNSIGAAYPDYADFSIFRTWEPGRILCKLKKSAWLEYSSGGFTALRDTLAAYDCFVASVPHERTLNIVSTLPLNSLVFTSILESIDGIEWGYPYLYCCDGPSIEVVELGATSRYVYRHAWGDCLMGCMYSHYTEFEVSDSEVQLIREWGHVPIDSFSWGAIKSLYR